MHLVQPLGAAHRRWFPDPDYSIEIRDHDGVLVDWTESSANTLEGAAAVVDFGDNYIVSIRARNSVGYGPYCHVGLDMNP